MANHQPINNQKINPFDNDIEKKILKQFNYTGPTEDNKNFDRSSLFIMVQNILNSSTEIVHDIAKDKKPQSVKTDNKGIDPKFKAPVCKLKEILSKLMLVWDEKSGGVEMVHETTISIAKVMSGYKLSAMAVLTLAAFAMEFGEIWLLFQSYQSEAPDQQLAKSMAALKRMDSDSIHWQTETTFKRTTKLIGLIMEVIQTMLDVENLLDSTYDPNGQKSSNLPVLDAYWIMLTVVACATQITPFSCLNKERQELTSYESKIREIQNRYNQRLNELKAKRELNDRYQKMLKVYEKETNIMEVFKAIFFSHNNGHQLINNSNSEVIDIGELKNIERVFLFISDLSDYADSVSHLEKIRDEIKKENQVEKFKIIWAPIPWNEEKIEVFDWSMIPAGYTIKKISDEASIEYMKKTWHYKEDEEPILVVMNSKAKVETYNAFHYINAAGGIKAFPFDENSLKQDLLTDAWPQTLVADHAKVKEWMNENKFVFFYGGRQKAWWVEFEKAVTELQGKQALNNAIELCGVVMSGESAVNRPYLKTKVFWSRLEGLFFTSSTSTTTTTTTVQEIHKLLSYKNADSWALLIRGSKPVTAGNGLTFLHVVKELSNKEKLDIDDFEATFINTHEGLIEKTADGGKLPCCRFEISSLAGLMMPEEICCPVCKGKHNMKKKQIIIYECCHI